MYKAESCHVWQLSALYIMSCTESCIKLGAYLHKLSNHKDKYLCLFLLLNKWEILAIHLGIFLKGATTFKKWFRKTWLIILISQNQTHENNLFFVAVSSTSFFFTPVDVLHWRICHINLLIFKVSSQVSDISITWFTSKIKYHEENTLKYSFNVILLLNNTE